MVLRFILTVCVIVASAGHPSFASDDDWSVEDVTAEMLQQTLPSHQNDDTNSESMDDEPPEESPPSTLQKPADDLTLDQLIQTLENDTERQALIASLKSLHQSKALKPQQLFFVTAFSSTKLFLKDVANSFKTFSHNLMQKETWEFQLTSINTLTENSDVSLVYVLLLAVCVQLIVSFVMKGAFPPFFKTLANQPNIKSIIGTIVSLCAFFLTAHLLKLYWVNADAQSAGENVVIVLFLVQLALMTLRLSISSGILPVNAEYHSSFFGLTLLMLFIWAAHSHLELFLSFESNAPEKSPLSQLFWALMTALFVWILTKYRHVIDEMLFRNLSNRHNRLLINFQTSISGGVYYIIAGSIILGYVAWFADYLTLFEYLRHQLLTTFVVLGSLSLMSYLIMLSHSYTHHKKISNITYRLIDIMALTATVYLVYCWIVPLIELYGNSPVNISDKVFGILVIVTITTLVVHGLNRFFSLSMVTAGKNKHLKTFLPILDRLSKLIVFVIATLLLLLELNVNIMPIVASFSILGLGVGLASKTIIEDFINGLFIIQENDFNIGDVVTVGTVTGTIENITLRKVHIRDAQGFLNFIPFSNVGTIVNRSRDYNVDKINIPLPSHFHLTRTVNILEDVGQQLLIDPDVKDYIISAPRFFGVAEFQLSPHPGSEVSTLMQFGVKTIPGKMTVVAGEFRKLAKLAFEEMERLM